MNKKNKKAKVDDKNQIMQQTDNRNKIEPKQSEPLINTPKSPKLQNIKTLASKSKSLNSLFKISNDQLDKKEEIKSSKDTISKYEINDNESLNEIHDNERLNEELYKQNLEFEILKENINEQKCLADEINDIISCPVNSEPQIDDYQLMLELTDLEYLSQLNNNSVKPNRPSKLNLKNRL